MSRPLNCLLVVRPKGWKQNWGGGSSHHEKPTLDIGCLFDPLYHQMVMGRSELVDHATSAREIFYCCWCEWAPKCLVSCCIVHYHTSFLAFLPWNAADPFIVWNLCGTRSFSDTPFARSAIIQGLDTYLLHLLHAGSLEAHRILPILQGLSQLGSVLCSVVGLANAGFCFWALTSYWVSVL